MPSYEEVQQLKRLIDKQLRDGTLGEWATKFLSDIREKLQTYGERTQMSEKQLAKIREILGNDFQFTPSTGSSSLTTSNRRKWRQKPKETRSFPRSARPSSKGHFHEFIFPGVIVVALVIYAAFQNSPSLTSNNPSSSGTIIHNSFSITDGDTIRISGENKGTRLVGFNTPETFSPRCEREAQLGRRATARLKEIVASSDMELVKVPCACPSGTEGTDACNFGRSCGVLRANGKDVGDILISEGLAVRFVCGRTSCPSTPRPWCD